MHVVSGADGGGKACLAWITSRSGYCAKSVKSGCAALAGASGFVHVRMLRESDCVVEIRFLRSASGIGREQWRGGFGVVRRRGVMSAERVEQVHGWLRVSMSLGTR